MAGVEKYICNNFKQRYMGLLCDFTGEINKVYTAVFPSDNVLTKILNDNVSNAMLFLHHPNGESKISGGKVAVAAGGGTDTFVINELIENGIDVLITGVTLNNKYTLSAHELAKENAINLLGGTHYSSEKFACIEMCKYFSGLGLLSAFVEDIPCFDDL